MADHQIENFDQLASNGARKVALIVAEAGLQAINTQKVIKEHLSFTSNLLQIKDQMFELGQFKKIYVVGFGKASCDAILAVNDLLKYKISSGIAIDIRSAACENPNIKIFKGSHPKPTPDNLVATQEILKLMKKITGDDLVICIVSGGGSALLCASEDEYNLSDLIYQEFLKTGGNINELNTLRKHLSSLKGGNLAKSFYPATIISLVFSDIPGGNTENVASGPTFFDSSTLQDVRNILNKYQLAKLSQIQFVETPKEQKYFEKVSNILLVSNIDAVEAMSQKAKELNLNPEIYSATILNRVDEVAQNLNSNLKNGQARLAGGEPAIVVYKNILGKGGRNSQLVLESLPYLQENQVFISLASDGLDNCDMAGVIADFQSLGRVKASFDYESQRHNLDSYPVFEKLGDLIKTGPTGSNVADLMISLRI